jgi:spoIIIJ-associated protein
MEENLQKIELKEDNLEEIKKIIEEFFKKIDQGVSIQVEKDDLGIIKINLLGNLPDFFCEEQFLSDLLIILSKVLRKKIGQKVFLDIDINFQKEKRINYLKALADELANEAVLKKEEKAMPPLNKKERRLIHLYLAKRGDVVTESQGQESERKIIIKPKE